MEIAYIDVGRKGGVSTLNSGIAEEGPRRGLVEIHLGDLIMATVHVDKINIYSELMRIIRGNI